MKEQSGTQKNRSQDIMETDQPSRQDDKERIDWLECRGEIVTVRRMTLRLHFSWPIRADEPVYVVYVGPKLTKR